MSHPLGFACASRREVNENRCIGAGGWERGVGKRLSHQLFVLRTAAVVGLVTNHALRQSIAPFAGGNIVIALAIMTHFVGRVTP